MRRVISLLLTIGILGLSACEKQNPAKPAGSLQRFSPDATAINLPETEANLARALFRVNGISLSAYRPDAVFSDNDGDSATFSGRISASHFINALPVFNDLLDCYFTGGRLTDSSRAVLPAYPVTNDTVPMLSIDSLRQIFLASAPKNYSGISHLEDSSLFAVLAYDDLNALEPNTGGLGKLVKVWLIQLGRQTTALAIIDDRNGKIYPSISFTLK